MNRFNTIWKRDDDDPLFEYSNLTDENFDYKILTDDEQKREVLNKIIIKTFHLKTIHDADYSQCLNCSSYTSNYCGSCTLCPHLFCKNKLHQHPETNKSKCCVIL